MKNKRTVKNWVVTSLLSFAFLVATATAQEAIVAAGIDVSGNGGSISYSVGQVVYQIHTGTNVSVTEGVQQSYRIELAPAIKKAGDLYLSFTAFPNPATDLLVLNIENFKNENLSFQVVDVHGRILHSQKITAQQTHFFMGNLAPSIYSIQMILDKKLINTFKIIKN